MQDLKTNDRVSLIKEGNKIEGIVSFNKSGKNTNLVMIIFYHNERPYKYPFSRKTGKLYGCSLDFEIKLVID